MQTVHQLKCRVPFFQHIVARDKTFEVRENDRGYQRGDTLQLNEYEDGKYSGNIVYANVSYVLSGWGIKDGFVVLGLANIRNNP